MNATTASSAPTRNPSQRSKNKAPNTGAARAKKELRREQAKARQTLRDLRSPEEQIALLNERLGVQMGVGLGAKKERLRLTKSKIKDGRNHTRPNRKNSRRP
jgi:hypothetical protein